MLPYSSAYSTDCGTDPVADRGAYGNADGGPHRGVLCVWVLRSHIVSLFHCPTKSVHVHTRRSSALPGRGLPR